MGFAFEKEAVVNQDGRVGFTRRQAVMAGVASAATAGIAGSIATSQAEDKGAAPGAREDGDHGGTTKGKPNRMPVAYIPHGGGPWPFVEMGFGKKSELDALAAYLRGLRDLPPTPPKALLVVSAHWEETMPTVMTSARPPMLYDYYGFPPESYKITWPAPGHPELAERVRGLLGAAGFQTGVDAARGFDHGTFVPMKLTYPDADVPTVQLSLKKGLDPSEHLAMGRAIAKLRDEGVFIVGSGMSYHNLRAFNAQAAPAAEAFDAWLRETATLAPKARDERLTQWTKAPAARAVHPREEHLLPLMVVAGAAGEDRGHQAFDGTLVGLRLSGYHFG